MKNKTCCLDPIDTKFIKESSISKIVAPYLSVLVNKSLLEGYFPDSEKVGIITPIIKANKDPKNLNSYRPVTSLSFISKLIENVVHEQLINFLNKNKLLPKYQSAYRYKHSTSTALLKIKNDIITLLAKGENIIYITLDLSSAFDTILHKNLLECLENIGLCGTTLNWFQSYLSDRKIKIKVKNLESELTDLLIGIPQGGVLSPTLYSVYTADICNLLDKHKIQYNLYADDIIIYFSTSNLKSLEEIQEKINRLIKEIQNYMLLKHLKINPEKTEIMHICRKHRLNINLNSINVNNSEIELKRMIKSIGFIIDMEFNMNEQISATIKKCNYALHCISKIRPFLDLQATKILINALVISKLEYNLELMQNNKQSDIEKFDKILRKCIRLIFKLKKRESVSTYMKTLNWLPIAERIKLKNNKIIHNSICHKTPQYIYDLFDLNENIYHTRQNNGRSLKLTKPNSEFQRKAISVYGLTIYNEIPIDIKNSKNFNENLRKYYLKKCFNSSSYNIFFLLMYTFIVNFVIYFICKKIIISICFS